MNMKELLLGAVVIAGSSSSAYGNGEFLVGTFAISPSTRKRPQSISMTS